MMWTSVRYVFFFVLGSVGAGIPDFRSPGGMYDTLRPDLITASSYERQLMTKDPTYVVSWDIFRQNAFPYLEVRKPFIIGTHQKQWKATIAHRFMELLHAKTNKLRRIYTQNIDGLDYQCTKIPLDTIVSVHGTIREAACEGCGHDANYDQFCQDVRTNIKDIYNIDPLSPKESKPILCTNCNQPLVKPKTVLFGRNLPDQFNDCTEQDLPTLDLLIIAGTSLVVSPANSLVYTVPETTKRVVVNTEPVGMELGIEYYDDGSDSDRRDFYLEGTCDAIFLDLIIELGWLQDLQQIPKDDLPPESIRLLDERLL